MITDDMMRAGAVVIDAAGCGSSDLVEKGLLAREVFQAMMAVSSPTPASATAPRLVTVLLKDTAVQDHPLKIETSVLTVWIGNVPDEKLIATMFGLGQSYPGARISLRKVVLSVSE